MTTDFPVFIVKIGGSLITNKDSYCTPNITVIRDFARVIKLNLTSLQNRLVLVIGGGSFGHGTALKFSLQNSSQDWKYTDLAMPTVKMFELLTLITMIFREEDIPCYPFQTSSYLLCSQSHPHRFFIEPIKHVLSMGLIPILSGDVVFDEKKLFVVFSSDGIPELFLDELIIKRVVMLTNVAGVLCYSSESASIISSITKENYTFVLKEARSSNQPDVSGGMGNKVEALVRLAKRGVESVICDGRDPTILMSALFEPTPNGTLIKPW